MTKETFTVKELGGYAWECAIENILEIMSRTSFRILTRRNDWVLAEAFANKNNMRFDANGNIV